MSFTSHVVGGASWYGALAPDPSFHPQDPRRETPGSGFGKTRNRQAIFVKKFEKKTETEENTVRFPGFAKTETAKRFLSRSSIFFFVDFFFKLFDKNRLAVSGFGLLDKNRLAVCLAVLDFLAFFRRFFDFFPQFFDFAPRPGKFRQKPLGGRKWEAKPRVALSEPKTEKKMKVSRRPRAGLGETAHDVPPLDTTCSHTIRHVLI